MTRSTTTRDPYSAIVAARRVHLSALGDVDQALFVLADALLSEWSPRSGRQTLAQDDYAPVAKAQTDAGLKALPWLQARQYRKVAEFWSPSTTRFDGVSFTAHRVLAEAKGVNLAAAKNAMTASLNLAKGIPGNVTVSNVKASMGGGKGIAKSKSGGGRTISVAAVSKDLAEMFRNATNRKLFLAPLDTKTLETFSALLIDSAAKVEAFGVKAQARTASATTKKTGTKTGTKTGPTQVR